MPIVASQGSKLKIGDAASPEVFTALAGVISFSDLEGGTPAEINVSDLDSTAAEFFLGLPDNGQLQVNMNYRPDNAAQEQLRTDRAAQTLRNFQVTAPTSPETTFDFAAYVMSVSKAVNTDDRWTMSATLRISGAVTQS